MARAARVAAAVSCSCNGGDILRCLTHKLETKTHEETENGWVGWGGGGRWELTCNMSNMRHRRRKRSVVAAYTMVGSCAYTYLTPLIQPVAVSFSCT